ncbi:MAG: AAA family ATPase [Clostridia bacterium]|nr:AAA family ATPase [Clostridia bacterium]
MSSFDKVIGYETEKRELELVCDMLRRPEEYRSLGARLPRGALLYGDPGLGKTLTAKCFIEECGLPSFTLRRKSGDDFIREINETFEKAAECAPAVVFLDDLDKFAHCEDEQNNNCPEYVAVQSCIDDVADKSVFVIATANDTEDLPASLMRAGRFDNIIEFSSPSAKDASAIIAHYLKDKKTEEGLNTEDLAAMLSFRSCAELDSLLNEAACGAAFERKSAVGIEDFVKALLKTKYDSDFDYDSVSDEEVRKVALHEAGHLVAAEVLVPGSVGFAAVTVNDCWPSGFVRRQRSLKRRSHEITVSLAGKAATELYYSGICASGCADDIKRAAHNIRDAVCESGTNGLGFISIDRDMTPAEESAIKAELERYAFKVRDILIKNREFLEKTADELYDKKYLLRSDIDRIKASVNIMPVAV